MEFFKELENNKINQLNIVHNVRLIGKNDLNPVYSKQNIRVQFSLTGNLKGIVNCYLCLDNEELSHTERNTLFPLFTESMNILLGKQISGEYMDHHEITRLSPPKINLNNAEFNSSFKKNILKYELEIDSLSYTVLIEYILDTLN
jgi:hypothetical protein